MAQMTESRVCPRAGAPPIEATWNTARSKRGEPSPAQDPRACLNHLWQRTVYYRELDTVETVHYLESFSLFFR